MIINTRLFFLFLLLLGCTEAHAASVRADNWWREDPNLLYYYIDVPTNEANLKTFYDLVLYHHWSIDITGMNASSAILARLVKDPENDKDAGDDHPFPQNKQWYEDILFRSNERVSYQITGDLADHINFINSMINSGYKEGFMKSNTPAFTQVITFYR